jgi:hypothetical protein
MKPWDKYRIIPGEEVEIERVRPVAHLTAAQRIVEDGTIRSGLVYDKSILNKSRIVVTWLSANTWNDGSLYGTVEFLFDWDDIVKDQKIYWVEGIDEYKPPAFRLLLSKRITPSRHVVEYDPEKDDGPLRFENGKWLRARNLNSEFMLEEDLSLSRCVELDFVKHHHRFCNLSLEDPAPRSGVKLQRNGRRAQCSPTP